MANRESSRTIVAECSACQIWIIVKLQSSIASDHRHRAVSTSTPSTNSSPGTVPSLGWPLIGSWLCAIACSSNRGIWPPTPSINNSLRFVDWLMKPPMQVC